MPSLLKNVASQNITFCLVTAASGAASTSTSTSVITAFVTKDATQASAGGTFSPLGSGQWNYAPTQSETNATNVGLYITATSCIPTNLDFHTDIVDANGFPSVNLVDIAGATVSTGTGQLGVCVVTHTATALSSQADAILDRDMSLGVDSGSSSVRTPRQAFRVLRNKVDTSSGSSLVVYKEDDATTSWTASITASSAAVPIVTLTPP
jgi:hypothetical protein